jgi:cytochrome c oxidase subunit 3
LAEQASALKHQFEDLEQQKESAIFGMWIFLVTEVMFFGGMFAGYTVYRYRFLSGFIAGSELLDWKLGAFNTIVLILSSFTMALAVHAAQTSRQKQLVLFLIATMALGSVFLGVKVVEYEHKFEQHLVPSRVLGFQGPPNSELFFAFYFAMTGFHALHMIIGIGILAVILRMALKGRFSADYNNPVEVSGLYWHFVDIVWIFLFPLLYLIGHPKW